LEVGWGMISREMIAFGINGAALTALGEIPADFFGVVFAPLGDRKEGVKLGESTFKVFFCWLFVECKPMGSERVGFVRSGYPSLWLPSTEAGFSTL